MTEFYVELQDVDGTYYGATLPWTDQVLYFEDLDEARLFAKSQLGGEHILARVIDAGRGRVVDYFKG